MNTFAPDFPSNNGIYSQNGSMPNANQGMFDPSMFQSQNMDMNRLQNTPIPNGAMSPAFPNQPSYQVNQVIPSKRARPTEENPGASPRPGSRSQTPQMPYPGFQGNQLQAHTPFQHLQQGGSQNATPSPTMQNQPFRPPGAPPQRVNTVSPNPNPYPQQNMGMSPPNGPGSRVGTPQNHNMAQMGAMNFMAGGGMQQGFNQNFAGAGGLPQGMHNNMPVLPPHLANKTVDAQRQYQMRLQAGQQAMTGNMGAQQRPPGSMNPMFAQGQNPNMVPGAGMRPGQPGQPGQPNSSQAQNLQHFLRTVASVMQSQGRSFNHAPTVCGQQINLLRLYTYVMKQQGSAGVNHNNGWPQVAQLMGFHPAQFPSAPQELKYHFEQNLGPYEAMYIAKSRQAQPQGLNQGAVPPPQMSPTRAMPGTPQNFQAQQQQYLQSLQRAQASQQEQMTPARNISGPSANGWNAQSLDQTPSRQANAMNQQHRKSMSRQLEATPPQGQTPGFPTPSPGPDKTFERAPTSEPIGALQTNGVISERNIKVDHGTEYQPKVMLLSDTHGGVPVEEAAKIGEDIARMKPNIPMVEEMGVIDVRALSLEIQSGIHGEMRNALDHLAKITSDPRLQFELRRSDDLLDILVDCAEDQVELLAEGAPEVSDIIDLNSYEDILRNCRQELESLQDIPEFGTPEHDYLRAADRLLAITVILRNLSFYEFNHDLLSGNNVIKFLSNTIRLMGTRILLLRTHVNTSDFMKDIITFFSNTTHTIALPSRDEAFSILHFLVAFAPGPPPGRRVRFTPFDPTIHKYLPAAVDCLAKLLARDDPNRAYYKQIFAQDASSNPPYDLLTRSFSLAISVIPDRIQRNLKPRQEIRISEARKPYLTQGMLAADIIASLAPGSESGVARSWLESEDGWAISLVKLAFLLMSDPSPQQAQPPHGRGMPSQPHDNSLGYHQITHRALNMLKRLAEKCTGDEAVAPSLRRELDDVDDDVDGPENGEIGDQQPNGILRRRDFKYSEGLAPKIETLMGALLMQSVDGSGLSKLVKFGDLFE